MNYFRFFFQEKSSSEKKKSCKHSSNFTLSTIIQKEKCNILGETSLFLLLFFLVLFIIQIQEVKVANGSVF